MKIKQYLSSIIPFIKSSEVFDDITSVRQELTINTLPPLKVLVRDHGNDEFKSHIYKLVENQFRLLYKQRYKGNIFTAIYPAMLELDNALTTMDAIAQSDGTFNSDVSTAAMSLKQATIMQYTDTARFLITYTRKLIDVTLTHSLMASDQDGAVTIPPLKPDIKWLTDNAVSYVANLNIVADPKKNFKEILDNLPEIKVSPDTVDLVEGSYRSTDIDPLRMGLIPVKFNPFFIVGRNRATWQASNYKKAQAEREALELKIYLLKKRNDGENHALTEERIETLEGRIRKINYKLEKDEKKYGLR